jgi:GDP-4-dehydro-6-deoxy-D-mannose reductase
MSDEYRRPDIHHLSLITYHSLLLKVLITGITGFVGGYLAEFLLKKSYQVYGTYLHPGSLENVPGLEHQATLYPCDLTQSEAIETVCKEILPDRIYHLAGMSNVKKSWTEREATLKANLFGALNLLESVRKFVPSAQILMVSSSEVYGNVDPNHQPIMENFPVHPVTPYAVSKASLELLCYPYLYTDKLRIVIVRPFNHTGPRHDPSFVCPDFARQIAQIEKGLREPIIHVGNLDARRDFSDVRDVVRGYHMILEKGGNGQIYNIASGKVYSIKELLGILISLSPAKIEIRPDPKRLRPSDIYALSGDITKVRHEIGWTPEIPICDTLKDILNYWRERV